MKKVLHISKYYYPYVGGTEQVARDCVHALMGKYEQKVIAFNDKNVNEVIKVDDIEVVKCGVIANISSQALSYTYKKMLDEVIHGFNPDIIIFHYPNPFVSTFLLPYLKKSNTKLIVYWHLDIVKQKILGKLFAWQNRRLLERADMVIATSPNYIEGSPWLKSFRNKCHVVPNCISMERMTITPKIEQRAKEIRRKYVGKTICLAVGRHTKYKGFTYLIQASKLLGDTYQFFITGTGEITETLHKEAEKDNKINFTGRIDDVELKALILVSDIFCFPSITKNEAFGLALAEAMYYGKPAITFTIPGSGVNYVSLDGITGIEVENRNVKEYAKAIEKLANDEELRKQYGESAQKRVNEMFLSTQYFQNLLKAVKIAEG